MKLEAIEQMRHFRDRHEALIRLRDKIAKAQTFGVLGSGVIIGIGDGGGLGHSHTPLNLFEDAELSRLLLQHIAAQITECEAILRDMGFELENAPRS